MSGGDDRHGDALRESSQAVSLAPWQRGRVSSAMTEIFLPASQAARITPRAVPYPGGGEGTGVAVGQDHVAVVDEGRPRCGP